MGVRCAVRNPSRNQSFNKDNEFAVPVSCMENEGVIIVRNRSCGHRATAFALVFGAIFSVLLSLSAHAQVSGATLNGTVTDSSGAVLAHVQVSIKNEGTGEVRTVSVDSAGFYSAPNLLPAQYDVSASATGFATVEQKDVTLTVGAQQVLNIKLPVGKVNEKVEVTDMAAAGALGR